MLKPEPVYSPGAVVCLRADPRRQGPVIEVSRGVGGQTRYRVYHAPGDLREYDEDQLASVSLPPAEGGVASALAEGRWLDAGTFRARLTAARIAHPLTDTLYALQAARIQFIPFQFKPLLRFLRSDRPRILIADEVGVGKTIEAGLIFKELQARQRVGNALIVCPKALVGKWRDEMRRFDEEFIPLTSQTLRYCLQEAHYDGMWPTQYARAIAHLELLRTESHLVGTQGRRPLPGLLSLDPAPHFDFVVVDEAHHLRNPETHSWELAQFLCEASEAVLLLSATPVHVGSRNLYTLLNLLRPDLFMSEDVLNEMIEPNRHLVLAARHVRGARPEGDWQSEAAAALDRAAHTTWGARVLTVEPMFANWHQRLHRNPALSDDERIRCLRDLEEAHTLAHVMNRTRRRDIGRFTIRDPHTVSVPFTEAQQRFYDSLLSFRRRVLLLDYDPRVVRLITDTLERQAASCLPALADALERLLHHGPVSSRVLSDDPLEGDAPEDTTLPEDLVRDAEQLRQMAALLPNDDPKRDRFLEIAAATLDSDGPGKLLVFSFFLHTLAYLERALKSTGCRVGVVTGQVPDDDREDLRDRFRLPRADGDAIDVLLSSEVGCEGLDYEFCDRLVNYDLPWNPMRIEQRIGRIDRYGQLSDKVLIFNFITPGTVEERIFFRCFERLDIFRNTVGDLEEVLGDVVEELNRTAFDTTLSPAQAEERARQIADNAVRLADEHRRLEAESGALLGLDDSLVEEAKTLVRDGRFVAPADLAHAIALFVAGESIQGALVPDAHDATLFRLRLNRDARATLVGQLRGAARTGKASLEFIRWLEGDDAVLLLTFDQRVARERRDLPFVTPLHPLARLAVDHWAAVGAPMVTYVRTVDRAISPGTYVFACDLWETVSLTPEVRLVGEAWDLAQESPSPEVSSSIVRLLREGLPTDPATGVINVTRQRLIDALSNVDASLAARRAQELGVVRQRNATIVTRRIASLSTYHRSRLSRIDDELTRVSDERISRMKRAERARVERDHAERERSIVDRRDADIVSQRIAAGVLEVLGEK